MQISTVINHSKLPKCVIYAKFFVVSWHGMGGSVVRKKWLKITLYGWRFLSF